MLEVELRLPLPLAPMAWVVSLLMEVDLRQPFVAFPLRALLSWRIPRPTGVEVVVLMEEELAQPLVLALATALGVHAPVA